MFRNDSIRDKISQHGMWIRSIFDKHDIVYKFSRQHFRTQLASASWFLKLNGYPSFQVHVWPPFPLRICRALLSTLCHESPILPPREEGQVVLSSLRIPECAETQMEKVFLLLFESLYSCRAWRQQTQQYHFVDQ